MKAVFWSNFHGQAKQTANIIAFCRIYAHFCENSLLITQTQHIQNDLEEAILGRQRNQKEKQEFYQDGGIDALIRTFKQGPLTEAAVAECCMSLHKNKKIHLLPGSQSSNRSFFDENMNAMFLSLLSRIETYYDLVVIDANPGGNTLSMSLLEQADIIIVSLSQNRGMIDEFLDKYRELSRDKRVFYLFGGYILDSKYCVTNLIRRYPVFNSKNTGTIPFSTGYMDALSGGDTEKFFEINLHAEPRDNNYEFIIECTRTFDKIQGILERAKGRKGYGAAG